MSDRPTILVPIRVLEGQQLEAGVVDLLSNARVILLGYHVLPEQTPPGQARMQFEDRARNRLDDLESRFVDAGATVETRLAFTHDDETTIERVARETDAVATLVPNPAAVMDDVLVAVRGDVVVDRIADVVGGLLAGTATNVTLFHVAPERERAAGERTLGEVRSALEGRGVDPDRIDTLVESGGRPVGKIVGASEGYDAVVMGESDPSVLTFVFGESAEQVADRFLGPVVVVRQERDEGTDTS